jgi:hypothetical protein
MLWELKNYLLEFNSPMGWHTGKLIGQDLMATMWKFRVDKKVSLFMHIYSLTATDY